MAPLQKNLSWSFAAFRLLLLDHAALEVGWLGFFIILKVLGFVQTGRERERVIMFGGGDEDVVFLFCYFGGWGGGGRGKFFDFQHEIRLKMGFWVLSERDGSC